MTAKCYMVKTESTADLISEIKAGIKKEISVGFATSEFKCSICGKEFNKCVHRKGQTYRGKTCRAQIADCTDAYEVSFVAVPAQIDAGTTKNAREDTAQLEKELRAKIRLNEILFNEV